MGTKLDKNFAQGVRDGVNALISEVERLEGEIEKIANIISPNTSPGGDTVWLVQNYVTNTNAMLAKLNQ